jgi:hypothetical protein
MENLNELKHLSPVEFDAALAKVLGERMAARLSHIPVETAKKPKRTKKAKAE